MKKIKISRSGNPSTVLSHEGVELLNCGTNRSTGFSIVNYMSGDVYDEECLKYYYILIVLKGSIKLSCKLFSHLEVASDNMVFVPKDSFVKMQVLEDSEVMKFAFTTTIIRTKKEMLNYFCLNARKFKYTSNTLAVNEEMKSVVNLIREQLMSRKIKATDICETWNTLFFHTIQTFYDRSKVVAFMRPIFSSAINFETFIENNYIESAGNVSYLIELSGIPAARFHSLFLEKYGVTAKAWLDNKARHRILMMASTEHVTVTDMAKVFKVSTQRFCNLCRRLFDCTPTQLIAREQGRKDLSEYVGVSDMADLTERDE